MAYAYIPPPPAWHWLDWKCSSDTLVAVLFSPAHAPEHYISFFGELRASFAGVRYKGYVLEFGRWLEDRDGWVVANETEKTFQGSARLNPHAPQVILPMMATLEEAQSSVAQCWRNYLGI